MEQVKGRTPILQTMHTVPLVVSTRTRDLRGSPSSRLTHHRASSIEFEALRQIVYHLVELDCKVIKYGTHPGPHVRLPNLKRLRFSPRHSQIEWLRAPKLEALEVYNSELPHPEVFLRPNIRYKGQIVDLESLSSFISHAGCVLRSLSNSVTRLRIGHDGVGVLGDLVATVPSLVQLELHKCAVEWNLLTQVIAPIDNQCPLPKLLHVVLTFALYPAHPRPSPPFECAHRRRILPVTKFEAPPLPETALDFLESLAGLHDNGPGAPSLSLSLESITFFNVKIRAGDESRISCLMENRHGIFQVKNGLPD
ncbi:hypothetical protein H0H81_007089 [Sphagnurus paluster]|uniref:Uncharacterized protein n=1 Tax=Sphagnurus paluster TaxID=117069 RepID=A0A9P7FQL6_9AGAR|nr:hypothetical protein H0H81_007089 [Sphagnurus paluster]